MLVALLMTIPSSAFAKFERKKPSKWATFLYALNEASAEKRINDAYNKSPYTKYAQNYTRLYQTGQISQTEYNDRMMEIEMLEMNRKRDMTNTIVSYAAAMRLGQMQQSIESQSMLQTPQSVFIKPRHRVTNQYGQTVGYIDEN